MKLALLVAILAAGCTAAPTGALSLTEECRLGAWLALHVAREAPPLKVPSPDKPDQGDTCDECGGTGKLGDGRVFVTCQTCNGTGKKPAAAFDTAASVKAFKAAQAAQAAPAPVKAGPPRDGRTYRKICDPKTGTCRYELVR